MPQVWVLLLQERSTHLVHNPSRAKDLLDREAVNKSHRQGEFQMNNPTVYVLLSCAFTLVFGSSRIGSLQPIFTNL